jgi:putative membrane protein
MPHSVDPRVFFAAERTVLAWVRTGIGVIGLGFVIAKFGLFLHYIAPDHAPGDMRTLVALIIGVLMVLLGAVACALAALQFRRFVRTLSASELPPRWSLALPSLLAWSFAGGGLVLALYLVL